MLKLIFTALIVYFAYKVMFRPKSIDQAAKRKNLKSNSREDEGEFVDYEEID